MADFCSLGTVDGLSTAPRNRAIATPTTTNAGIFVTASSTFDSTLRVNGGVIGDVTGDLTGNADTATDLADYSLDYTLTGTWDFSGGWFSATTSLDYWLNSSSTNATANDIRSRL